MKRCIRILLITATVLFLFTSSAAFPQEREPESDLDRRVRDFLESRSGTWQAWNVPESDGRLLHDIILRNNYTRALEIGTSTGHSTIWIAWALSKTGGRLTTVEIDESRHRQALENFRKAGLSEYIDARLADARELVPKLEGPFDFVFSDADKEWYGKYFDAVAPKLVPGGCIVSHNVSAIRPDHFGLGEYVRYLRERKDFDTTFDERGAGLAISYKRGRRLGIRQPLIFPTPCTGVCAREESPDTRIIRHPRGGEKLS